MSHELRTPLNAMLGVSRLLAGSSLTLEQEQLVDMIQNSGQLLLSIINDILDFSKIESGRFRLHAAPHKLLEAVETAMSLCHDTASTKSLDLNYWIEPQLVRTFRLDATRLQQILLNLLSNGESRMRFSLDLLLHVTL